MTCPNCNHIKVILANGSEVCTWSRQWLIECEARQLLKLPLDERRERLNAFSKARGNIDDLKQSMIDIFNKGKSNE